MSVASMESMKPLIISGIPSLAAWKLPTLSDFGSLKVNWRNIEMYAELAHENYALREVITKKF